MKRTSLESNVVRGAAILVLLLVASTGQAQRAGQSMTIQIGRGVAVGGILGCAATSSC